MWGKGTTVWVDSRKRPTQWSGESYRSATHPLGGRVLGPRECLVTGQDETRSSTVRPAGEALLAENVGCRDPMMPTRWPRSGASSPVILAVETNRRPINARSGMAGLGAVVGRRWLLAGRQRQRSGRLLSRRTGDHRDRLEANGPRDGRFKGRHVEAKTVLWMSTLACRRSKGGGAERRG
jgi:hypothetical protein